MNPNQIQRKLALEGYSKDPNICLQCGSVINVPDNKRVSEVRRKKFCNRSCSASYTNNVKPKRVAIKDGGCKICGTTISYKKMSNGRFSPRDYCDTCLRVVRSKNSRKNARSLRTHLIENMTKKEVFAFYKNWQSARNEIRKDAKRVHNQLGLEDKCELCGYGVYNEVCHISDVSSFSMESKISEINNPLNLVKLCPNHHKELDTKYLCSEDIKKAVARLAAKIR
jgi:hypothetical protein